MSQMSSPHKRSIQMFRCHAIQIGHAESGQVHTKYSYGLRHLIQQSPTWISLINIVAIMTSGTNRQS